MVKNAITNFDVAIASICGFLVPSLIGLWRTYRRTLRRSPDWILENMAGLGMIEGQATAQQAVDRSMALAIGVSVVIFTVSAILISVMTSDLDSRTSSMVKGISNFTGAFFIFLLSYSAPKWLAVYHSILDEDRRIPLGSSLESLQRRVQLRVWKEFLKVYPLILPFFCGAKPATIPLSVATGVVVGFIMCFGIDFGNRHIHDGTWTRVYALSMAGVIVVISAWLFAYGVGYVYEVWGQNGNMQASHVEGIAFALWFVAAVLMHVLVWYVPQHHLADVAEEGQTSVSKRPRTFFGESVFVSRWNLGSKRNLELEELAQSLDVIGEDEDEENQQPEDNVQGGQEEEEGGGSTGDPKAKDPSKEVLSPPPFDDEEGEEETAEAATSQQEETNQGSVNKDEVPKDQDFNANGNHDAVDGVEASPDAQGNVNLSVDGSEQTATKAFDNGKEETAPPDTPATVNDANEEDEDEDEDDEKWCSLLNVACCGRNCGRAGRNTPFHLKLANCMKWSLWGLLMAASLFFVVLLIGAAHQEVIVTRDLGRVYEILYNDMNNREVCTFDDRGNNTRRSKMDATQRSFDNVTEAHAAGYSVLHCGACGKCSDYVDLRQEYTTRNILGQVALKCAKKVLIGGTYDDLLKCTMDETGFEEDCARCWATDYQCVKQQCIFISIRAFMINTVTNLAVGKNDITPATCEEARCEATEITGYEGFVPCSGASRRRMNVKSSIKRDANQQCNIVDVTPWENFFGPSDGNGDFIEGWGE